jgi:Polyketide cyclase / dehydrase and lipid transport
MKLFSSKILIEAPAASVWPVLADVENWPRWAETFTWIKKLEEGACGIGTRVNIKQPKLSAGNWTITEWYPGRSFKWVSRKLALTVTGDHILVSEGECCIFHQSLMFEGLLSNVTGALGGSLIKNYMACEAEGLKDACEKPQLPNASNGR